MNFLSAYIICYGNWDPLSKSTIQTFVSGLGNTPWWGINRQYGMGPLVYKGCYSDVNHSQGRLLIPVANVVLNAINNKYLPGDWNGIYLVLTSRYGVFQTGNIKKKIKIEIKCPKFLGNS